MKDDAEYKILVGLIRDRASILKKLKTAKGREKEKLQKDLEDVQKWIRRLDQKQN